MGINIWIPHVWQESSRILHLVMQYLHIFTTLNQLSTYAYMYITSQKNMILYPIPKFIHMVVQFSNMTTFQRIVKKINAVMASRLIFFHST